MMKYNDDEKLKALGKLSKKNIGKYTAEDVQYLKSMLSDASSLVRASAQDTLKNSSEKLANEVMGKCQKNLKRERKVSNDDILENRYWFLATIKKNLVEEFREYNAGPLNEFLAGRLEKRYMSLYETTVKYDEITMMMKKA